MVKKTRIAGFLLVSAFGLSGCDNSSTSKESDNTTTLSVTVIDGYLQGALVWLDTNGNGTADSDEPQGRSGAQGVARLSVPKQITIENYSVMALATPENTIDADTGNPVPHAFVLSTPPGQRVISPLTTLVAVRMKQNLPNIAFPKNSEGHSQLAVEWVAESLGVKTESVLSDFIEEGDPISHYAASTLVLSGILPLDSDAWQQTVADDSTINDMLTVAKVLGQEVTSQIENLDPITINDMSDIAPLFTVKDQNGNCPTGFTSEAVSCVIDTDGDQIGNIKDEDDDGDGVKDADDAFPLDKTESVDTDNDGIGNNADPDDDNDGVNDDNDQLPLDPTDWLDTDSDGIGNITDTDDDNDGVEDSNDLFPLDASETIDSDGDGIGNNRDTDDDNDNVADVNDAFPLNAAESVDTDNDGIGNNTDIDDDNDNVADINDAFPLDDAESVDTDGDGIGNNRDTDDDNDSVSDSDDAFPFDASETTDTDSDGIGNNRDSDDDNDGVTDSDDAFPLDTFETKDSDNDGVGDNTDVFPTDPNEWADSDGDYVGDNTDAFPDNAAASIDQNGDGLPERWNSQCFKPCQDSSGLEIEWDGLGPATLQGRSDGIGVDLVILGDGFTADDKQAFKNTVNGVIQQLYNEASIKQHIRGWNIHVVGTESNESGIKSSPTADHVDTFFDSYFGCHNIARLYCVNVSRVKSETNKHFPQWDILLLAGNSKQYGGAGYSKLGTFSLAGSAIQIAIHELGHSFAGLADEYSYGKTSPPWKEPNQPNITINSNAQSLKWKHWIDYQNNNVIPAESHRVGHFEGGRYVKEGVWRPTGNSIMRSLGKPFHAVNAEAWALKVYQHGAPILSQTPAESLVNAPIEHMLSEPVTLSIESVYDINNLQVEWFINGTKADNDEQLSFTPVINSTGAYHVEVKVKDSSGLILNDPKGYSQDSRSWHLEAK
ncbi:hypothetical protein CS022_06620 [Veronia nyctiphanis]|uniref:Uncharacterized protein n=1 Tax=Veronia nyctiphanis TaxID=1278244 RepID=A0A4Q0YXM2_9GAMM|nr:M64 family metallopeptidase [Veronia nyctiphanis]RXJ73949.1 hypothetical protein CS022_06620 [Veronia nyctiphanis]